MSIVEGLALFGILWWLTLFIVLPWGVHTQADAEDVVPGTAESAPMAPMLLRKALATTVIAALLWGLAYGVIELKWITLEQVPFLPNPEIK